MAAALIEIRMNLPVTLLLEALIRMKLRQYIWRKQVKMKEKPEYNAQAFFVKNSLILFKHIIKTKVYF